MKKIPDDAITEAIKYFGLAHVRRIRHELVEGMRHGDSSGYVALRGLLGRLEQVSQLTDGQVQLATERKFIEDLEKVGLTPVFSPTRYQSARYRCENTCQERWRNPEHDH